MSSFTRTHAITPLLTLAVGCGGGDLTLHQTQGIGAAEVGANRVPGTFGVTALIDLGVVPVGATVMGVVVASNELEHAVTIGAAELDDARRDHPVANWPDHSVPRRGRSAQAHSQLPEPVLHPELTSPTSRAFGP